MITLVGVGHVFAISDSVKELIRSKRPEGVGPELALIDMDASAIFAKLWRKMSLKEKVGLFVGAFAGLVASKATVEREMEHYTANDAEYIEKMADGFPTIKEVLIDERNRFMADRISSLGPTQRNIVAVGGDG